jgi:hypothetical protein
MIPTSSGAQEGPSRRRRAMADKKIQPKAASREPAKTTVAAAGVEKKSLQKKFKRKKK